MNWHKRKYGLAFWTNMNRKNRKYRLLFQKNINWQKREYGLAVQTNMNWQKKEMRINSLDKYELEKRKQGLVVLTNMNLQNRKYGLQLRKTNMDCQQKREIHVVHLQEGHWQRRCWLQDSPLKLLVAIKIRTQCHPGPQI